MIWAIADGMVRSWKGSLANKKMGPKQHMGKNETYTVQPGENWYLDVFGRMQWPTHWYLNQQDMAMVIQSQ